MRGQDYRFVFIVGASGSGTTLLTRILSEPPMCVGLGGNHISIPLSDTAAMALATQFNEASKLLWDRQADAATATRAGQTMVELIDSLRRSQAYRGISHVIYKRSFPFFAGDRYRPDLSDLFRLFEDVRLVVVQRDPRASTVSSLRRGFGQNLRSCAIVTEEQLTYIAAQLATFDPACFLRIGYEDFCREPAPVMQALADFCGLPHEALQQAAARAEIRADRTTQWASKLRPEEVEFLERFFDRRRRNQWEQLSSSRASTSAKSASARSAYRK